MDNQTRMGRRQVAATEEGKRHLPFFDRKMASEEQTKPSKRKREKVRMIPIWLRLVIFLVLIAISICLGLMVGYGVIGNGDAIDALKLSTWKNLVDLVLEGTPNT